MKTKVAAIVVLLLGLAPAALNAQGRPGLAGPSVERPRNPIPGLSASSACPGLLRAWEAHCSEDSAESRRCRVLERELERHGCEAPRSEAPEPCIEIDAGFALFGVPVLADDGTLYAATRSVPLSDRPGTPGYNHRILALRADDLSVAWGPTPLGGGSCDVRPAGGLQVPALSADGRRLYVHGDWNDGSSDYCAGLFMYDTAAGALQWRAHVGGPHPRHPAVVDDAAGVVYYGGHAARFGAFDATGGSLLRTYTSSGSYGGGAGLLQAGDLVVSMAFSDLVTRFATDGTRLWDYRADELPQNDLSISLGLDDDVIVTDAAALRVLDGATGALRWSRDLQPFPAALVDADGAVFVVERDPDAVHALERDGSVRWQVGLAAESRLAFLSSDGVVVLQDSRRVLGLATATGEELWRYESPAELTDMLATLLPGGDLLLSTRDGRLIRLCADLDYAEAPWPRARGNRFSSGRAWDLAPLPPE